jgi:hypothetical protein
VSLRERLDEIKSEIKNYDFADAINEMKDIASDYGKDELVDEFIPNDDMMDDFVKARMESSGWQGVACCISDIVNCMSDDYYEIDGYGNLKEVTQGSLECTLSDLERNLSDELEMEEDEEE